MVIHRKRHKHNDLPQKKQIIYFLSFHKVVATQSALTDGLTFYILLASAETCYTMGWRQITDYVTSMCQWHLNHVKLIPNDQNHQKT